MSKRDGTSWRWGLGALFLVGLVVLNLFPPDSSNPPWKDPIVILLAIAMAALCFVWVRHRTG
ncbi:MAG: hypothetical protein ACM3U2_05750 [Deltaproteobacteria bacterium]